MKINNRHIGGLFALLIAAGCHYFVFQYWSNPEGTGSEAFKVLCFFCHIISGLFWAGMTILLLDDEIRFETTIPTPLTNYRKTLKARKELNDAITAKYVAMAKAQGAGFDRLHNEVAILEERLEKIEL